MSATFTTRLATALMVAVFAMVTFGCSSSGSDSVGRIGTDAVNAGYEGPVVAQTSAESPGSAEEAQAGPSRPRMAAELAERYQARKIGELLGQTPFQDSFTDFPYHELNYDLVNPQLNWITDDNMDAEDTFTLFSSTNIDRGGWTEHRLERDKPGGRITEYITAYTDGVNTVDPDEGVGGAEEQPAVVLPEEWTAQPIEPVEPVNFGWWLELPKDVEDTGYKFATFVDEGNRISHDVLSDLDTGEATYKGPVAGIFVKRERTTLNTHWGRFTARVSLRADFFGFEGGIGGEITDFVDSDNETALDHWQITLPHTYFNNFDYAEEDPHFERGHYGYDDPFGTAEGMAAGYRLLGEWQGNFYKGSARSHNPGTVAGQFRLFSHTVGRTAEPGVILSVPKPTHFNDEGFMGLAGAFGVHLTENPTIRDRIAQTAQSMPVFQGPTQSSSTNGANIRATAAYYDTGQVTYQVDKLDLEEQPICFTSPCPSFYDWRVFSGGDEVSIRPSRILDGVELHKAAAAGKLWIDVGTDIQATREGFSQEQETELAALKAQQVVLIAQIDLAREVGTPERRRELESQLAQIESQIDDLAPYLVWGLWEFVPDDLTGGVRAFEVGAFVDGNNPFGPDLTALTGSATYAGKATGVYAIAGHGRRSFDADANLTANFGDDDQLGTIGGDIRNFRVDGEVVLGNPALTLSNASLNSFRSTFKGDTSITLYGRELAGKWGGEFYGDGGAEMAPSQNPTSVAGTFGATTYDYSLLGVFRAYRD